MIMTMESQNTLSETCPSATLFTTNSTQKGLGSNLGLSLMTDMLT